MYAEAIGVGQKPTPFPFKLIPAHKPDEMLENVRYAMSLSLPDVQACAPHDGVMSIAGGGPSLQDTWHQLDGYVAAVNGSLAYLIEKGVTPQMCGVCDPRPHLADVVEAVPGVVYFLASCVHRAVYDKLLAAGCKIHVWHLHPIEGQDALLRRFYKDKGWVQIPGGSTMGTRWLTLGYHLGFRKFAVHGLDSSFRGKSSHAYPDRQDTKEWMTFDGYQTRPNFLGQVTDFIGLMEDAREGGVDPIEIKMFGDGLLQFHYAHWLKKNPPLVWPVNDVMGKQFITADVRFATEFLKFIPRRGLAVQAGGNVGVYPRRLGREFRKVHTFEPQVDNFGCLLRNMAGYDNVTCHYAALGSGEIVAALEQTELGNVGTFKIVPGRGIQLRTIDALDLPECDLIWLDVEGYETRALAGASLTIQKYKPAIIIEEKDDNPARQWLEARQYYRVTKYGNDCLYVYGGEDD